MVPSPLYKYRTLDNWSFLEDIFQRSRLYAATFRALNDPMEGLLYEHDKDVSVKYRKAVSAASGRLNICSLSDSSNNTLLWSYSQEDIRASPSESVLCPNSHRELMKPNRSRTT